MGKAKKSKMARRGGDPILGGGAEGKKKKVPLDLQLRRDAEVEEGEGVARAKTGRKGDARDAEDEFLDQKLTRKILDAARDQQEELQEEFGVSTAGKGGKGATAKLDAAGFKIPLPKTDAKKTTSAKVSKDDDDDDDDDDDGDLPSECDSDFYQDVHIDEEEEKALEAFMSKTPAVKRTLADIIMEKLTEKKTEIDSQCSDNTANAAVEKPKLDQRIIDMYKTIGEILAKYRSGKLPKAFKVIPRLGHWEYLLHLTNPDKWSAAAVFQATRIFSSSLNNKMAQRFYFYVLYPRVRDDIEYYKVLNFHLFMALKKALFKPAAFFKGILLPLAESGNCTLREATIISSILAKCSIPMLHSSAALLKLAEMEYSGANSIFVKTLLDKKYALPFRVIDALVFHFVKFEHDHRILPVLWHQALLVFVQRYKEDISSEQKEALYGVLRVHFHAKIGPEIRRELQNSKSRDEETPAPKDNMDEDLRSVTSEDIDANYQELFG